MSDSERKTLFASRMGVSYDPHLPPPSSNYPEPEIISLSDDFDSERVFRNSLQEEPFSSGSLDVTLSNVGRGINHVEVPKPPHVLIEEEILAKLQRRECFKDYIQHFLKTDGCEPNDADVKVHLDLRDQSDMVEYNWVDT